MLQQIALGGAMIALPIYLQMVLEYNAMQAGLSLAPLSLSMFGVALLAGQEGPAGDGPAQDRPRRVRAAADRHRGAHPGRAAGRLGLVAASIPLLVAGSGLGLLVSQLNNYTLSPISEERVSEAAGVNSAAGSFGLSFGLALAGRDHARVALAHLHEHGEREHRAPAGAAAADRDDARARRRGDEQHAARSSCSPASRADVQAEIIRINTRRGHRSLQVALLVPVLAALAGLFNSFRMIRLPDPVLVERGRRPGDRLSREAGAMARGRVRGRPSSC